MPNLEFKGKQIVYAHHLTIPYRPLVSDPAKSLNPAGADDNLIIHGDNLKALKALLPRYAGRVKCIYIDPPCQAHKGRQPSEGPEGYCVRRGEIHWPAGPDGYGDHLLPVALRNAPRGVKTGSMVN